MRKIYSVLFLLALLALPALASAQVRYIRSGAAGNNSGTDWANALPSMPLQFVRGDTYYIADGSYGVVKFNTPVSGTSLVTLKKATIADHGTSTGWSDTYGDGTAVFTRWDFFTSNFLLDGQVGGGPKAWTAGHGFAVAVTGNVGSKLVTINANNISNITIRHTRLSYEYNRKMSYRNTTIALGQDIVYNPSYNGMVNWSFSYCFFERPGRVHFLTRGTGNSNWLVEYSFLEKSGHGDPAQHSEIWSHYPALKSSATNTVTNVIIRYNYILDYVSTGGFMFAGGTNIQVYGNVFRWSGNWGTTALHGACSNWSSPYGNTSWKIYNNTFIDLHDAGKLGFGGANSGVAYNNIWWNSTPGIYGLSHDYNWFQGTSTQGEANGQASTTSPFVSTTNFQLKAPTRSGFLLAAPFNLDGLQGIMRGSDGVIDRGAFEYNGSSAPAAKPGSPLSVTVQ